MIKEEQANRLREMGLEFDGTIVIKIGGGRFLSNFSEKELLEWLSTTSNSYVKIKREKPFKPYVIDMWEGTFEHMDLTECLIMAVGSVNKLYKK